MLATESLVLLYACCLALAVVIAWLLERTDGTPVFDAPFHLLFPRVLVSGYLYTLFYMATWRPLTALGLFAVSGCVLITANRLKKAVVFEPLVFSDFALLGQVLRHPHLYYLDRNLHLTLPGAALAVAFLVGALLAEPALYPAGWVVLALVVIACTFWLLRRQIERHYRQMLLDPASGWGTARLGLTTALVLQAIGAASQGKANFSPPLISVPAPARDLVVLQLESFIDLGEWPSVRHALPVWRSLCSQAAAHGQLLVDARGANTMRTEFSVLTGLAGADLGFERFDPYLLRHENRCGIPAQLRESGWSTSFIHPNDIAFFRRHLVMPELGFDQLIDGSDFTGMDRVGPYVSDAALVEMVLMTIDRSENPAFITAVSMENHGPWYAGRLPGKSAGLATYLAHQDNMDEALGRLVFALRERPSPPILILYGDHTPALTDCPEIALKGYPSYLIVDLSSPVPCPVADQSMRPEELLLAALRFAS